MDKYNKSINTLIEDILNEAKTALSNLMIEAKKYMMKPLKKDYHYGKRKLRVKDILHVNLLRHLSSLKSV